MSRCGRTRPPGRGPRGTAAGDAGSVTAETAVVLPALLLVLTGCLWAMSVVHAQLECIDASRVAARIAARGDGMAEARAAGAAAAPAGASVAVRSSGGWVDVVVRAEVTGLPGLGSVTVESRARGVDESAAPGVVPRGSPPP